MPVRTNMIAKIKALLSPPVFENEDEYRLARILNTIQLSLVTGLVIGIPALVLLEYFVLARTLLISSVFILASIWLSWRRHIHLAGLVVVLTLLGAVNYLVIMGQGIHDIAIMLYPLLLLIAGLLLKRNAFTFITLMALLSVGILAYGEASGLIEAQLSDYTGYPELVFASLILVISAYIIRWLADDLFNNLEKARRIERKLEQTNRLLELQAKQLTILNQVGTVVTSGLDLEDVLTRLYEQISNVFSVEAFYAGLYEPKTGLLTIPVSYYQGKRVDVQPRDLTAEPGLSGRVISTGRTHYLPDVSRPGTQEEYQYIKIGPDRTRCYLGIPLILEGEVIGMLSVQSQEPYAYTQDEIRLLETISAQAAIAIKNAQLYAALGLELAERKRAEEQLIESEALYRWAITAADAVPYYIDYRTESYKFIGEGVYKLTGYTAEEMTPYLIGDLIQETEMRGALQGVSREEAIQRTRAGESLEWKSDSRILTRSGESRWFTDSSVQVFDESGKPSGAVGILIDITERKRAEIALRQSEGRYRDLSAELERRVQERTAELEAANQELEAFAYSISHDLRTPLRGIAGYSQLLLEEVWERLDETSQGYLDNVISAAHHMGRLIDDLLTLSRVTRADMSRQAVDLSELAVEVVSELQVQEPERRVEVIIQPGMIVQGDPHLMRIVLENLLGNAWKFTSKTQNARIEMGIRRQNGRTVYFVRDNGVGFNMKYADKVFGTFERLHKENEFEGTGIGLATVERVIQRHGGKVWAEGVENEGATFYFWLR